MGANSTQGIAVAVFLAAFTVLAAGLAQSGIVLELLGLVGIVASIGLFVKCKPWENTAE